MRGGWIEDSLGNFFETATGSTPSKSEKHYYGKGVPLVKPPELKDGEINSAQDNLTEEGAGVARVLPPKSIMVSCIGNLGKVGINSIPVAFNQQINAIKPSYEKALPEFMFYQVLSPRFIEQLNDLASGTTVPIVNKSKFNSVKVKLPPIEEQKRIVAILDEAFAGIDTAIANTQQNFANARELFESYLNNIFTQRGEGWEEKGLSDVCEITSSLVDPRLEEFIGLPHIGAGNIISKTGELVVVQTAREEGLKSGKFLFDEQMVLYSKIRPYLEKVARPTFSGLCSADMYPLMPKKGMLSRDFLYYLLLSRRFTDYAIAGSARAGMPKVNRNHLFQYTTALPDMAEQKRLVEQLDAIEAESKQLESIYQQKLTALNELKQSLLQQAFSGRLTAGDKARKVEAVA